MGKNKVMKATSFAIDSNSDSCLLYEIDGSNEKISMVTETQQLVPETRAIYSLFSENTLLLNWD
jgi:hypothetical protein